MKEIGRKSRKLTRLVLYLSIVLGLAVIMACTTMTVTPDIESGDVILGHKLGLFENRRSALQRQLKTALAAEQQGRPSLSVQITHPFDGSVFPADLAAPDIIWEETAKNVNKWLIKIDFEAHPHGIRVISGATQWRPGRETWEHIKALGQKGAVHLTVLGLGPEAERVVSRADLSFTISPDKVVAPLLYQQIPLPFAYAFKNTKKFQWRLADLGSYQKPRTIIKNMPKCVFCHNVSANGKTIGLDMDFRGDKGGYLLTDIDQKPEMDPSNVISWNDLPVIEKLPNMGLFAKISPDGRYVAASVGEKPFMAILDHLDFSQLFFPISGRIAIYDRQNKTFNLLPGADNPDYVQASPAWSPDGRTLYFARAPVDQGLHKAIGPKRLLKVPPGTDIHTLNKRYRIQYDLYRVPFNDGAGGTAEPLAGASNNQMSNYFPRVSPDGRWIVFTQCKTGLVAQPDSRLMMVPSAGGTARVMRCNTPLFNSWHSWSPNSRWLVFASKVNTPFTELFLTHIDADGNDSPPVLLSRLASPRLAAVIPEFVNRMAKTIGRITFNESGQ